MPYVHTLSLWDEGLVLIPELPSDYSGVPFMFAPCPGALDEPVLLPFIRRGKDGLAPGGEIGLTPTPTGFEFTLEGYTCQVTWGDRELPYIGQVDHPDFRFPLRELVISSEDHDALFEEGILLCTDPFTFYASTPLQSLTTVLP